ncbi:UDP-N-acetylmuramate dehydrogenase [Olsenella urininfantis]|uniref:UDP-N-acetylmuramate dehydrogenase n=1 Tax=Olsenella urininfantis TaxID=1871033 RepID=UPI000BE92678|nr:UDP-N-acetylmuramate dehydrogenase [Olsenella urininfantis]
MSAFNAYMALSGAYDADVVRNERLSLRTSYRIGGPADLLVTVHSYKALLKTIEVLSREKVEWVILGRGSNVLVSDEGYRGCVIKLGREFSRVRQDEDGAIVAGAGANLSSLVSETLSRGLSGLEFCAGIPGSVGGALAMNAGSRHEWMGGRVTSMVTLRPAEGLRRWSAHELEWGYRWTSLPTSEIILEASFALVPKGKEAVAFEMERRMASRRQRQPLCQPSCGSVFRNPGDKSAGRLIQDCGLKGYRVGGAQVSELHANFIINTGSASAQDVLDVMRHVHDVVLEAQGIDLLPELKCLGFGARA